MELTDVLYQQEGWYVFWNCFGWRTQKQCANCHVKQIWKKSQKQSLLLLQYRNIIYH